MGKNKLFWRLRYPDYMPGYLKSVRSTLQFCTILPLGDSSDYDSYARRFYLFPLVGYVTGGIAALLTMFVSDPALSAAVALAAVMVLNGFHHFDGLLDLGDGMMAHGSREKRLKALSDQNVGAGGIASGMLVILLAYAGLMSIAMVPYAILIAEVLSRFSPVFLLTFGEPIKEGMHSYTHDFGKKWFPYAAFALCVPALFLAPGGAGFMAAGIVSIAVPLLLLVIFKKIFGGVNGDMDGASVEISRMAVIACLALVL
jgi:adenosylcobinamide-GDP ribazoletransferase